MEAAFKTCSILVYWEKNGAQISEKPHICISVTASAFYTLQHKRRQCEGLLPSAPPHSSASASLLWQPSNKVKAKVRRKKKEKIQKEKKIKEKKKTEKK